MVSSGQAAGPPASPGGAALRARQPKGVIGKYDHTTLPKQVPWGGASPRAGGHAVRPAPPEVRPPWAHHNRRSRTMAKTDATTERKVGEVMHEFKEGELKSGSGKKVRSRKQAIAIALSEARDAGGKVPDPPKKKARKTS
jgi:hypothetical protein